MKFDHTQPRATIQMIHWESTSISYELGAVQSAYLDCCRELEKANARADKAEKVAGWMTLAVAAQGRKIEKAVEESYCELRDEASNGVQVARPMPEHEFDVGGEG